MELRKREIETEENGHDAAVFVATLCYMVFLVLVQLPLDGWMDGKQSKARDTKKDRISKHAAKCSTMSPPVENTSPNLSCRFRRPAMDSRR